jgi:hypothetical protein
MKKAIILVLSALLLVLAACSAKETPAPSASPTPTPTKTETAGPVVIGPPAGSAVPSAPGNSPSPSASPSASASPSSAAGKLYDPSIFVIKASGKWQQELAKGYYADNECDIYLHKIDQNDNRQVNGTYQGVFWFKTTVNADEYIKDMLKNVPVKIDFGAGGEAVADNFGIVLNTEDDKAWVNYSIPDKDGKPLPLTQDTPVAKGSFVAVSKAVYLKAKGSGAQGEKIDYSDFKSGDTVDMNYVVHVQPDSEESGTSRKVVFYITAAGSEPATVEGTLTRLPGYPEDVSKYLNSKEYQEASRKHLEK